MSLLWEPSLSLRQDHWDRVGMEGTGMGMYKMAWGWTRWHRDGEDRMGMHKLPGIALVPQLGSSHSATQPSPQVWGGLGTGYTSRP